MRILLYAMAVIGFMVAGVFTSSFTAHADENGFISDTQSAGLYNRQGNSAEISVGLEVCSQIAGGSTPYTVAYNLWLKSGMTQDESALFVVYAIRDLCPAYTSALPSSLRGGTSI